MRRTIAIIDADNDGKATRRTRTSHKSHFRRALKRETKDLDLVSPKNKTHSAAEQQKHRETPGFEAEFILFT